MCGIVFARTSKGRASKLAFRRYQEQKKRGNEGYGAVCVSHGIVDKVYRSEEEDGVRAMLGNKSGMVLFHHRKPTSTPNFEECTHPIFVSNELLEYDYYVVHNGMISNAKELKEKFEKLGFIFTTEIEEAYKTKANKTYVTKITKFNDSESLAIDLAIAIEEGKKALDSRGSIAFVAMQVDKGTKEVINIFYGRNMNNPLVVHKDNGNLIIASEGTGEVVPTHLLFCYDVKTKTTTRSDLDIGLNYTPPVTKVDPVDPNPPEQRSFMDHLSYPRRLASGTPGDTHTTNSVLDRIKHNGHHATHDIMRASSMKHAKHMTRREQKRLRFGVKELEIMVADRYGKIEDVKYIIKGECLLYTRIYQEDVVRSMLGYHWEWYLRVIKTKHELEDIIAKNKKKPDFDKEPLVRQLKNCSVEFDLITDAVNKIAVVDIKNRDLLDEVAEIKDSEDREWDGWDRIPGGYKKTYAKRK